jgi:hypothetical protein
LAQSAFAERALGTSSAHPDTKAWRFTMGRLFLVVVLGLGALSAQQPSPAAPYVPKQSDRPEALAGDEPGFQAIFDGKTLAGWEGNPAYWRVENGSSRAIRSSCGAAAVPATSN